MTLSDAMRRARSNLYRYEENTEMFEREESLVDTIRERGSRVEPNYDKPGRASHYYEEAAPSWFLALEDAGRAYWALFDAVTTVRGYVKYLQELRPELFELYAVKYRDKTPIPEVRRRFGRKSEKLDQRLIFGLIEWHGWRIEQVGGEDYEKWIEKRWGIKLPRLRASQSRSVK